MTRSTETSHVPLVVLVAEDEQVLRMAVVAVLSDEGFVVLEAAHADSALFHCASRASEINVLFTDIHMPGSMDGLGLAHHVRGRWPWISLLIASGVAFPPSAEMPPGSRFLLKPYDFDHVIKHVREFAQAGG